MSRGAYSRGVTRFWSDAEECGGWVGGSTAAALTATPLSLDRSGAPYYFESPSDQDVHVIHEALYHEQCILEMCLIALDGTYSSTVRSTAIEEAERECVENRAARDYVLSVLYSAPLRSPADVDSAQRLANLLSCPLVLEILERVGKRQSAIAALSSSWDELRAELFMSSADRRALCHFLIRKGMFRTAVDLAHDGRPVDGAIAELLTDREIVSIRNIREIVHDLFEGFDRTTRLQHGRSEDVGTTNYRDPRYVRPANVFDQVTKQKEAIKAALTESRDVGRARQLIAELAEFQSRLSEPAQLAKSLCDLAQTAKDSLNWDLEVELTQQATELAPEDDWAWAQYARALEQIGLLDEALVAYQRCASLGGGSIARTGEAHVLRSMGEYYEAVQILREVLTEEPDSLQATLGIAETLMSMGELNLALTELDEASSRSIGVAFHPYVQQSRARILALMGRDLEALDALANVAVSELDAHGVAELHRLLIQSGRSADAEDLLRIASRNLHTSDVNLALARVAFERGDARRSAELLESVLRQGGAAPFIWRSLVLSYLTAGDGNAALEAALRGLSRFPADVDLRRRHVEALSATGDLDAAQVAAESLVDVHPSHVAGHLALSRLVARRSGPLEALEVVHRAIGIAGQRSQLLCMAGDLNVRLGRPVDAREWYLAALKNRPAAPDVVSRLEWSRALSGELDEARQNLESYRARYQRDFKTGLVLAKVYSHLGRLDAALSLYQELRWQRPLDPTALRGWLAVALKLNAPIDERAEASDALATHLRALRSLASGDIVTAASLFRDAFRSSTGEVDAPIRAAFAVCLLMLGDVEESLRLTEELGGSLDLPVVVDLVRAHVFGAAGRRDQADLLLREASTEGQPLLADLKAAIRANIGSGVDRPSDLELLGREARLMLTDWL